MQEISIKAETLFHIGNFGVTNSLVLTFFVSIILIAVSLILHKKIRLVPGVFQSGVEMGMEWFLNLMNETLGSLHMAEQYFPLIATIFIFILCSNLLGIFPGVGSITIRNGNSVLPVFRSP